jgi:membrane protease YdiL (CAAX protease family)
MIEFRGVFILWPIITVLFFVGSMVFIDGFGVYLSALYESTDGWMLARVSRDFLLIDAFPEEAFYRAFMIGLLSLGFRNKLSIGKYHLSQAALISVPLFAISHVQVSLIPFTIIAYDTIQLTLTLITGLLFAYAYERTHSIAVPILLHGYTNLVITVSAYVVLHLFIH